MGQWTTSWAGKGKVASALLATVSWTAVQQALPRYGIDSYDIASCQQQQSTNSPVDRVVSLPPSQPLSVSLAALHRWLERYWQGADVAGIEIRPSQYGLGVFAGVEAWRRTTRSVWGRVKYVAGMDRGDVVVAAFPLSSALTARNLTLKDSNTAEHSIGSDNKALLTEMLEDGCLDENTVVMLSLLVERSRGAQSPLNAWISLLPQTFTTPLFWSDDELSWLRGTTLEKAVNVKKQSLQEAWRRLEPCCQRLAVAAGMEASSIPSLINFEGFLWAYSVYWSRAVDLSESGGKSGPTTFGGDQNGVVPGLDFINHSSSSKCRYSVDDARGRVCLMCPKGARIRPGQELTMDYGQKSNEELLFLYGFVEDSNPNDSLMIACPLPQPSDWDESLQMKVQLLQVRGLLPQIFLPARFLLDISLPEASTVKTPTAVAVREMDLPRGVMETLEVFVMEKKDIAAELSKAEAGILSRGALASRGPQGSDPRPPSPESDVQRSGLRLAVLTTVVRLLELKLSELESGTGPLEADLKLLLSEKVNQHKQRCALVYRASQKRLAREYLVHCNRLLQQEMHYLQNKFSQHNL